MIDIDIGSVLSVSGETNYLISDEQKENNC